MIKTFLVIGNACSGTSITTGTLDCLGVKIAHSGIKNEQNPKGSFELKEFNKAMIDVRECLKSQTPISPTLENEIKEIISINQSDLWGLKGTLCHSNLDFWEKIFDNLHIVLITRNVLDNAISWKYHCQKYYNRDMSLEYAINHINKETYDLISSGLKSKCPVLWTNYERIKYKPLEEAEKMAKFIGTEFNESHKQKILQLIDPNQKTID